MAKKTSEEKGEQEKKIKKRDLEKFHKNVADTLRRLFTQGSEHAVRVTELGKAIMKKSQEKNVEIRELLLEYEQALKIARQLGGAVKENDTEKIQTLEEQLKTLEDRMLVSVSAIDETKTPVADEKTQLKVEAQEQTTEVEKDEKTTGDEEIKVEKSEKTLDEMKHIVDEWVKHNKFDTFNISGKKTNIDVSLVPDQHVLFVMAVDGGERLIAKITEKETSVFVEYATWDDNKKEKKVKTDTRTFTGDVKNSASDKLKDFIIYTFKKNIEKYDDDLKKYEQEEVAVAQPDVVTISPETLKEETQERLEVSEQIISVENKLKPATQEEVVDLIKKEYEDKNILFIYSNSSFLLDKAELESRITELRQIMDREKYTGEVGLVGGDFDSVIYQGDIQLNIERDDWKEKLKRLIGEQSDNTKTNVSNTASVTPPSDTTSVRRTWGERIKGFFTRKEKVVLAENEKEKRNTLWKERGKMIMGQGLQAVASIFGVKIATDTLGLIVRKVSGGEHGWGDYAQAFSEKQNISDLKLGVEERYNKDGDVSETDHDAEVIRRKREMEEKIDRLSHLSSEQKQALKDKLSAVTDRNEIQRQSLDTNVEQEVEKIVASYVKQKSIAIDVATDAMTSFAFWTGAYGIRAGVSLMSSIIKRNIRAHREYVRDNVEGSRLEYVAKDVCVNSVQEWWRGIRGKGEKEGAGKLQKSMDFAKAAGMALRVIGIGTLAVTGHTLFSTLREMMHEDIPIGVKGGEDVEYIKHPEIKTEIPTTVHESIPEVQHIPEPISEVESIPQVRSLNIQEIHKGEGILHGVNRALRVAGEDNEILSNMSKSEIHAWKMQELKDMGFVFKGGKWGYPMNVHAGAEIELYVDPEGQPHFRVIGEEGKTVTTYEHAHFRGETPIPKAQVSAGAEQISHENSHRIIEDDLQKAVVASKADTEIGMTDEEMTDVLDMKGSVPDVQVAEADIVPSVKPVDIDVHPKFVTPAQAVIDRQTVSDTGVVDNVNTDETSAHASIENHNVTKSEIEGKEPESVKEPKIVDSNEGIGTTEKNSIVKLPNAEEYRRMPIEMKYDNLMTHITNEWSGRLNNMHFDNSQLKAEMIEELNNTLVNKEYNSDFQAILNMNTPQEAVSALESKLVESTDQLSVDMRVLMTKPQGTGEFFATADVFGGPASGMLRYMVDGQDYIISKPELSFIVHDGKLYVGGDATHLSQISGVDAHSLSAQGDMMIPIKVIPKLGGGYDIAFDQSGS